MLLKPGETYSGAKLTASTKAIQDRLGALGYAFANANAQPELDRDNHRVAFTIFVDPGRRVYVRRINVTGNTKTRDEVVRREMRQAEGGWYDVDAIKLSKERLERLAYFKEVNVETPQVSSTTDQVDVNVAVTEKPTGTFNIGAGYSALDKVILTTSIQQGNLFGSGQNVGLEVNTSSLSRTAVLSGTDPYFTDNGVSRTVDLFYRTIDPTNTDLGDFSLKTAGTGLSFGVPFTEYDTVFFGMRYEHTKLDTFVDSPAAYVDYVQQLTNNVANCAADSTLCNTTGQTNSVIGTIGWQRDSRDSAINPTRGRYQRVNARGDAAGRRAALLQGDVPADLLLPAQPDVHAVAERRVRLRPRLRRAHAAGLQELLRGRHRLGARLRHEHDRPDRRRPARRSAARSAST